MAFPNVSDIVATTIESRSKKIADNVLKNNLLLAKLNQRGNVKPFSGGSVIFQELSFAENGNASWYSGYDLLSVAAQDVISAAQYNIKQLAVPVVISGLEQLQNSGSEAMIDLLESRISVAEATMQNYIAQGVYSDGTGSGGKTITGLDAAIPTTAEGSQTDTYGGISRSTWAFWRTKTTTGTDISSATKVQTVMNSQWASQIRGSDRPDLIIMDPIYWADYVASLQAIQRFTDPGTASLGFPTIKYMDADVGLDGGIGGFATTKTAYFLNTKYIFLRPHKARNMVALNPSRRYSVNQDAEVQILAWAGNLTCSGAQFQGRNIATTT